MRLVALLLLLACARPVAPVASGEAPPAAVDTSPVALTVNGLSLTRAQLEARAPTSSDAATLRQAQAEAIDLLLAAAEAAKLAPYRDLPPLVAGQRLLDDQFAPERFCQALPEAEVKAWYRAHRARFVHPARHAVAALTAGGGDAQVDLARALEAALADTLADGERTGASAFEALTARWEAAVRALGADPGSELWSFVTAPDHPERTPPARRHPEDTAAIVTLAEGERSAVLGDDDGARVYVKLQALPAARRALSDPDVRDEVRRRACAEHTATARQAWLAELRKNATVVVVPSGPR